MAATKRNAMLIEEAREKIRTTQLINRLQDHALGKVDMSPTQVRAVEVLLKKRVPDLATTTIQGDEDGGAVRHEFEWKGEAVEQPMVVEFVEAAGNA